MYLIVLDGTTIRACVRMRLLPEKSPLRRQIYPLRSTQAKRAQIGMIHEKITIHPLRSHCDSLLLMVAVDTNMFMLVAIVHVEKESWDMSACLVS
jgi:hypothetical protein